MATVTVKWKGHPPCGEGSFPYVGQQYYLFLDQSLFTADVSVPILATFASEGLGGSGYDKTYSFDFADSDIPNGFSELDGCHIKDVECISSCCASLTKRVDALEEFGNNTYVVSGQHVLAGNFFRLTRNDAVNVDIPISPITVSGGTATNDFSGGAGITHLGDRLQFFSEGGLSISVLGGIGNVQIEPKNITVAAVTGAPVAPADPSRPAVHFGDGTIYYWDSATVAWLELNPAPPRVLSDFVGVPAGAPSTIDSTASDDAPALYWSRDDTAVSRLWAWDFISQQWSPVSCCPVEPIAIPSTAFVDPQVPLEAEWAAYILANSNGVAGQTFLYNRPGQGGTVGNPDYVFLDTDGSGASSVAISKPLGSLACPILLNSTAFLDPQNPTPAEITAAIGAASNGIPGQLIIYNRPLQGGTSQHPDYAFIDADGSGTCPVEVLVPSIDDVDQPFQNDGVSESATTSIPVPGNVDAYRTGATLIGGADASPLRSVGTFGETSLFPQFEVIGTIATGFGNHSVTGTNAGVLGGNLHVASGSNSLVAGGLNNQSTAARTFSGGGQANRANFEDTAILGGSGNTTSGFRCAIAGGWNSANSGQQSLVSGSDNNNSGSGAFVCGSLNVNIGSASIVGGSSNTVDPAASLIGGTGNDVNSLGFGSCLVGNTNVWDCSRSLGAGDNNNSSGFGSVIAGLGNITATQRGVVCGNGNTVTQTDGLVVGSGNTVVTSARSIVGGITNNLELSVSSIVSGQSNTVKAGHSLVIGSNHTVGTAGGSSDLLVSGNGIEVADGIFNSTALGAAPRLLHNNNFIFSAHAPVPPALGTPTIAANAFTVHAAGGARFLTNSDGTAGAELLPLATAWSAISLRDKKTEIVSVTSALDKVNRLGVYEYSYKDEEGGPAPLMERGEDDWVPTGKAFRQLGPMADGEDGWHDVVGTGAEDSISSHDMAALALAAIKELAGELEDAKARITQLEAHIND